MQRKRLLFLVLISHLPMDAMDRDIESEYAEFYRFFYLLPNVSFCEAFTRR